MTARRRRVENPRGVHADVAFTPVYDECSECSMVDGTLMESWVNIASFDMREVSVSTSAKIITHVGRAGNVYASASNIYLSTTNYNFVPQSGKVAARPEGTDAPPEEGVWTVILKFSLNNGDPKFLLKQVAKGVMVNQFAMDEHEVGSACPPHAETCTFPFLGCCCRLRHAMSYTFAMEIIDQASPIISRSIMQTTGIILV